MSFTHLSAAQKTDQGRVRKRNEDSILALTKHGVFCVADGMGGAAGGAEASNTIVKQLKEAYCDVAEKQINLSIYEVKEIAKNAIENANVQIRNWAKLNQVSGSGSTVVILLFDRIDKSKALVLWAGDSRAYRIRCNRIKQLTNDHSLAEEAGFKSEKHVPAILRGRITRAVGIHETVKLDEKVLDVKENDLFFICSDGLTRMVSDRIIQQIWRKNSNKDLEIFSRELIDAANEAGGADNISTVIVSVEKFKEEDKNKDGASFGEYWERKIKEQKEGTITFEEDISTPKLPPKFKEKKKKNSLIFGGILLFGICLVVSAIIVGMGQKEKKIIGETSGFIEEQKQKISNAEAPIQVEKAIDEWNDFKVKFEKNSKLKSFVKNFNEIVQEKCKKKFEKCLENAAYSGSIKDGIGYYKWFELAFKWKRVFEKENLGEEKEKWMFDLLDVKWGILFDSFKQNGKLAEISDQLKNNENEIKSNWISSTELEFVKTVEEKYVKDYIENNISIPYQKNIENAWLELFEKGNLKNATDLDELNTQLIEEANVLLGLGKQYVILSDEFVKKEKDVKQFWRDLNLLQKQASEMAWSSWETLEDLKASSQIAKEINLLAENLIGRMPANGKLEVLNECRAIQEEVNQNIRSKFVKLSKGISKKIVNSFITKRIKEGNDELETLKSLTESFPDWMEERPDLTKWENCCSQIFNEMEIQKEWNVFLTTIGNSIEETKQLEKKILEVYGGIYGASVVSLNNWSDLPALRKIEFYNFGTQIIESAILDLRIALSNLDTIYSKFDSDHSLHGNLRCLNECISQKNESRKYDFYEKIINLGMLSNQLSSWINKNSEHNQTNLNKFLSYKGPSLEDLNLEVIDFANWLSEGLFSFNSFFPVDLYYEGNPDEGNPEFLIFFKKGMSNYEKRKDWSSEQLQELMFVINSLGKLTIMPLPEGIVAIINQVQKGVDETKEIASQIQKSVSSVIGNGIQLMVPLESEYGEWSENRNERTKEFLNEWKRMVDTVRSKFERDAKSLRLLLELFSENDAENKVNTLQRFSGDLGNSEIRDTLMKGIGKSQDYNFELNSFLLKFSNASYNDSLDSLDWISSELLNFLNSDLDNIWKFIIKEVCAIVPEEYSGRDDENSYYATFVNIHREIKKLSDKGVPSEELVDQMKRFLEELEKVNKERNL